MRIYTFFNRLALGALLCVLLQAMSCGPTLTGIHYQYTILRPGGAFDHVVVEREIFQTPTGEVRDILNLTVNNREIRYQSDEYKRYLSMLYVPGETVATAFGDYRLEQLGDPTSSLRPNRPSASPNPPIPDPTLGTRPKS
jgi:hypothetical protein